MIAAREVLLKVRAARSESLQRFRTFASSRLNEFIASVDPITGARMVELLAEGSKVTGDLSVTIAFFDGTRLRIAIDSMARMAAEATPPEILHEVGTVLDIIVAPDLSRAEMVYEKTVGPRGARARLDLDDLIRRMVDLCAEVIEEESASVAPPAAQAAQTAAPAQTAPVSATAAAAKPGLSYSIG